MKTTKPVLVFLIVCLLSCVLAMPADAAVTITEEPKETYYVVKNDQLVLSCSAVTSQAGAEIRYQWNELENAGDKKGEVVSSLADNSSTYSPDTSKAGTFYYIARAFEYAGTNGTGGVAESKIIRVIVMDAPANIDTQPSSQSAMTGDTVTLKCSASSESPSFIIRYQWYQAKGLDTYEGAVAKSLSTIDTNFYPKTELEGTKYYFCRVCVYSGTTKLDEVDSDIVKVEVQKRDRIEIITQPESRAVEQYGVLRLAVGAEAPDGNNISYEWFSCSDAGGSNPVRINNASHSSFLPPTDATGKFYYYCVAESGGTSVVSDVVLVTVSSDADKVSSINSGYDSATPSPSPTVTPDGAGETNSSFIPWWAALIIVFAIAVICEIAITHKRKY